jgi:serine/threonine protein kinase
MPTLGSPDKKSPLDAICISVRYSLEVIDEGRSGLWRLRDYIAAIYGLEESGGVRALVMKLVEGHTLAERISAGPLPLAEALNIAKQIAEALEAAHEKGITHRDLKPANVKVTPAGVVKVLDFGLAKIAESVAVTSANPPTLTMRAAQVGVIMGTAAYMSPEQARGVPVDNRADIWSYGVVLYEMLTGREMFSGETVSDTLVAVLKTDIDWQVLPPGTPARIQRLLRRCLLRDRKKRLADIADARLEIDEALAGAPVESAATRVAPQRTRALPGAIAAVLAVVAVALALLHFRESPPEQRLLKLVYSAARKDNVRHCCRLARRPSPGLHGNRAFRQGATLGAEARFQCCPAADRNRWRDRSILVAR